MKNSSQNDVTLKNDILSQKSGFWQKRHVLVTGGTGFIGSHLVKKLDTLGSYVVSIGLGNSSQPKSLMLDVLDYEALDEIIKKENIDTIYHLAAQPLVIAGQEDPYSTYKVNVIGTLNVLESARKNGVRRVVVSSTSHVYGNNPDVPYLEDYFPRPTRPYETSKSCADILAQSYINSFDLSVMVARFANTYGGGDLNFSRIVPLVMKSILENRNVELYGGKSVRDYIYIDDVIEAYLKLGELNKYKDGESHKKSHKNANKNSIFNFGGGHLINVTNLAKLILKVSGRVNLQVVITGEQREGEVISQYVSFEKAKKVLDWSPKYSLEEGLRKTFEWYKANLKTN